jgi:hypothetical protein
MNGATTLVSVKTISAPKQMSTRTIRKQPVALSELQKLPKLTDIGLILHVFPPNATYLNPIFRTGKKHFGQNE